MNRRKLKEKEKHISARRHLLLAGIAILIILTTVIAWMIYDYGVLRTTTYAAETLEAVARLKSNVLSRWYDDQLNDVQLIAGSDQLTDRFLAWQRSGETSAWESLSALLEQLEREHDISRLLFCTPDGRVLGQQAETERICDAALQALRKFAADAGQPGCTGLYLSCSDSSAVIDFITRLSSIDAPAGVFLITRCKAANTIFPTVEPWPLPSRSAESYLVRNVGDSLVFLSNPRFLPRAPLRHGYRRPDLDTLLSRTGGNGAGLSTGMGYRGVRVLTYLTDVSGTPWHLIAEMDEKEVYDTAWSQTRLLIILVISTSVAIIAIALFFYSHSQTKVYRQMLSFEKQYANGQKRLQQEIRKSERRYRAMFEDHRATKLVIDAESGQILDANRAAVKFYGWSREQLRAMSMHQINTLPIDQLSRLIREVVDSNRTHYEMRHRCSGGVIRDVEVFASHLDFQGRDAIYSVIHDVTEKKRAEQWNRLLGRAVEQSSVSVMIMNTDGVILYANPELAAMAGYATDALIGQSVDRLKSEEDAAFYRNIERAILSGEDWQGEFHRRQPSGEDMWQRAEISPVVDHSGEVTHVIAILTDVTDEKRLITDLTMAKKRAEESDRLKSAFLANMSHEIRTPLNAIIGFADLLTAPELPEEEIHEFSTVIKKRSFDLLNILNDILDISMIEMQQIKLVEESCNVHDILGDLYTTFRQLIRQEGPRHVELHVDNALAAGDHEIRTDPYRLRQVLSIFLSNAVKFTETGRIVFGCHREGSDRLCFFVSDTGIGIDSDDLEIIFDRFRQVEDGSTRRFEGNGLGLAIAQGIVELMGGSITVESRQGEGSTFSFTIPLKRVV